MVLRLDNTLLNHEKHIPSTEQGTELGQSIQERVVVATLGSHVLVLVCISDPSSVIAFSKAMVDEYRSRLARYRS